MPSQRDLHAAVLAALRKVAPEADPATLSDEADVRDELDIDSMDFLSFITALHKELGVDVPEKDYPKLTTVGGAVSYLETALG